MNTINNNYNYDIEDVINFFNDLTNYDFDQGPIILPEIAGNNINIYKYAAILNHSHGNKYDQLLLEQILIEKKDERQFEENLYKTIALATKLFFIKELQKILDIKPTNGINDINILEYLEGNYDEINKIFNKEILIKTIVKPTNHNSDKISQHSNWSISRNVLEDDDFVNISNVSLEINNKFRISTNNANTINPNTLENFRNFRTVSSRCKERQSTSIKVCNIPPDITEDELFDVFNIAGRIQRITIPKNKYTGGQSDYCYIRFYDIISAGDAIKRFNNFRLYNAIITVEVAPL